MGAAILDMAPAQARSPPGRSRGQIAVEEFVTTLPEFRVKDGFQIPYFVGNILHVPDLHMQWGWARPKASVQTARVDAGGGGIAGGGCRREKT